MIIECSTCGRALTLPDDVPAGAEFRCCRCDEVLRNTESARSFRWGELDPFLRRHGSGRGAYRFEVAFSLMWFPAVAVYTFSRGGLAAWPVVLGLGLPPPVTTTVLRARHRRRRIPREVLAAWGAILAGSYFLWAAALLFAWQRTSYPAHAAVSPSITPLVMGTGMSIIGLVRLLRAKSRAARAPVAHAV